MQINLASLFLLKGINKKQKNSSAVDTDKSVSDNHEPPVKTRKQRFADWMSAKPEPIKLFPGENEIFRKGLVLVTDTRLAYIDPFDRMLKTYMFEHMISTHKQFYRTTDLNRRLCKGLLFFSILAFLVILTIDLLDTSQTFFLVYIPLFASILIGIKVWNDMKPRYLLHWRMRDLSYGEIVQEPMLRERMMGNNQREVFMNDLANAMNQALSAKSWWPGRQANTQQTPQQAAHEEDQAELKKKPSLTLVTENYE